MIREGPLTKGLRGARRYVSFGWWAERLQRGWARAELRWLAAILVLATALRIVWVLYAARQPQGFHDPSFFYGYGFSIAFNGISDGYSLPERYPIGAGPTAYYPIGYPAALGGVFSLVVNTRIPDSLVLANGFFQLFLGVATVALVFYVGRELFTPAVGLLAALWLAVFPNIIFHTATFLTETLFNFLVMAALAVLLSGSWKERRLGWGPLALFGALLGLSALVRPISVPFLLLLLAVLLLARFDWRKALAYTAVALAATVAVILPWTIRNTVVMDSPVVISTNIGDNLCIGHHPGAIGGFALPAHCGFQEVPAEYVGLDRHEFEVARNDDNTRRALRFAVENPRFELKLLSRKSWYLWRHDHDGLFAVESYGDDRFLDPDLRTALTRVADNFFYFTISLGGLGLLGLVLPPRDPRRVFFLLALLALAGAPLVFFGDVRFHVPVMPLLVVSSAWAVLGVPKLLRLLAPPPRAPAAPRATEASSGLEEVAEGGTSVTEHDAL